MKNNNKFLIKYNGKRYRLIFNEEQLKNNNNNLELLFFKEKKKDNEYNENKSKNFINIIISEINPDELYEEINKYSWLSQTEYIKLKATYQECDNINIFYEKINNGEIIIGDYFAKKLYINDYYAEEINYFSNIQINFGFNLTENYYDKEEKMRNFLTYILNSFKNINSKYSEQELLLNKFIESIYNCLSKDCRITNEIYKDINENGVKLIYEYLEKIDNSIKGKYPAFNNASEIDLFIQEKNLPQDYYPYFNVSSEPLYKILTKNNYLSIEQKYESKKKECLLTDKDLTNYNGALEEINNIINKFKKFSKEQIKFKKFENYPKDSWYEENEKKEENEENEIFYFSDEILQNESIDKEWKIFILGKCLDKLCGKIQPSDFISKFNFIN